MPLWASLLLGFGTSTAVLGFIQFMINRHDKKKDAKNELLKMVSEQLGLFKAQLDGFNEQLKDFKKQLRKQENDSIRTQLLLLMDKYPSNVQQIMMLAEYYFCILKSNWYLTGIFQTYLKEHDIPAPHWFKEEHHSNAD